MFLTHIDVCLSLSSSLPLPLSLKSINISSSEYFFKNKEREINRSGRDAVQEFQIFILPLQSTLYFAIRVINVNMQILLNPALKSFKGFQCSQHMMHAPQHG